MKIPGARKMGLDVVSKEEYRREEEEPHQDRGRCQYLV
jgi:hypothetical protein